MPSDSTPIAPENSESNSESSLEPQIVDPIIPTAEVVSEYVSSPVDPTATETETPHHYPATTITAKRLHPTSFFFNAISHIRSYIVPFVLALFGAAQDEMFWQYLAAIILVGSLVSNFIQYLTLNYSITNGDLILKQGIFFKRIRTIPVRRIQNVDLIQNVLHRMMGVAEVRIETASGTEAEAVLRVLSLSEVGVLRLELFGSELKPATKASDAPQLVGSNGERSDAPHELRKEPTESRELLRIPLSWLAYAGLASDRGMLIVGVAIGALFQFNFDWGNVENIWKVLFQFGDSWIAIGLTIAAVLLAMRLFSVVWFILRFHGYRLTRIGDDLRISCGLLTKVSATIPRQRIQFISVHRSLVLRWMGFATIRIETAGGGGKEGGDSAATTRAWFVPVVPVELVPALLAELRPGLDWDEQQQTWQPVSPGTGRRLMRTGIVMSMALTLIGLVVYRPWGGLVGVVWLPFSMWLAVRTSRAVRYARTEFGMAYRSGIMTRKLSMTFYERIQSLKFSQSPFDRSWKMASLSVDTAAAGPAGHLIQVPYLEEEFAREEFERLRQLVAQHRLVWK